MRKRFFLNCLLILVLVVVMSTSAFAISESDVESAVSTSGKEAVSGNVLVWFLCAIAFLKVSQKIDSFLSSLGLNVGHILQSLKNLLALYLYVHVMNDLIFILLHIRKDLIRF